MARGLGSEELGALYARYAPVIHRRARAILGRDADAWDAVQEVFERMLQAKESFRGEARPMTYVYRVTTNVSLNLLRRRAVREDAAQAAPVEEAVEPRSFESAQLLRLLLLRLSGREQEIAVLHFLDGMTQEEIAELLGVSRKTVVRDLARLRAVAAELTSGRSGDPAGD